MHGLRLAYGCMLEVGECAAETIALFVLRISSSLPRGAIKKLNIGELVAWDLM